MVLKPVPGTSFKQEVQALQALIVCSPVVTGDTVVLFNSVLDVFVHLGMEGCWSARCYGHVNNNRSRFAATGWSSLACSAPGFLVGGQILVVPPGGGVLFGLSFLRGLLAGIALLVGLARPAFFLTAFWIGLGSWLFGVYE